jgi:DNA polymerase-4
VLATLSPRVEPVSIDEAYLDVSGLEGLIGLPEVIGRRAKDAIRTAVGLTASVGIGPNRLIAKLASEAGKPDGLTVVPPEQVSAFLDPMPLTVLRGLGAKSAPRLTRLGLTTVGDVRALALEALRRHLGAQAGTAIYQQARGIADDEVHPERARQSISKEITFGEDVEDPLVLREEALIGLRVDLATVGDPVRVIAAAREQRECGEQAQPQHEAGLPGATRADRQPPTRRLARVHLRRSATVDP